MKLVSSSCTNVLNALLQDLSVNILAIVVHITIIASGVCVCVTHKKIVGNITKSGMNVYTNAIQLHQPSPTCSFRAHEHINYVVTQEYMCSELICVNF